MKSAVWFIPPVLVSVGILSLSTFLSIPVQIEGTSGIDKWEHAFAYMVLAFSFLLAFRKAGLLNKRIILIIVITSCLYGILLEFVQYSFFPNRYFEWADAIANVIGTFLGLFWFKVFRI